MRLALSILLLVGLSIATAPSPPLISSTPNAGAPVAIRGTISNAVIWFRNSNGLILVQHGDSSTVSATQGKASAVVGGGAPVSLRDTNRYVVVNILASTNATGPWTNPPILSSAIAVSQSSNCYFKVSIENP